MKQVKEVKKIIEMCGPLWDGVLLAIKVPENNTADTHLTKYIEDEALSNACFNEGFEYVDLECQSTYESKGIYDFNHRNIFNKRRGH